MDERALLELVVNELPAAGDDAAVVGTQVLTTDMLHKRTDLPAGTTRYTTGWRAVGVSLSDLAAMGADATAVVAVYAAPSFESSAFYDFLWGARDVCTVVGAEYVGGDLDGHQELTVATTALGRTDSPIFRSGASPSEAVCVTGTLGWSAAALRLFERGEYERANDLFRFTPRIATGRTVANEATAMIDSSDGLARSLHHLAEASDCGIAIETPLPIDGTIDDIAADERTQRDLGVFFGEDFELVFTVPADELPDLKSACDVRISRIGTVIEPPSVVTMNGEPLPDRGFTHGCKARDQRRSAEGKD